MALVWACGIADAQEPDVWRRVIAGPPSAGTALPYVRTGPDARAADYARRAVPPLGASIPDPATNLADELTIDASAERRELLAEWGPWLTGTGVSDNARQLVALLEGAGAHGLDPQAYKLDELRAGIAQRERAATLLAAEARHVRNRQVPEPGDRDVTETEYAAGGERLGRHLDDAFASLATHLGRGVVDARTVQRGLYRDPPEVDVEGLAEDLARGLLDVNSALLSVAPTHPAYRRLSEALALLLDQRERGVRRTRVPEIGTDRAGQRRDDVMDLKRRLVETGDLPPDTVLTPMFDAPLVLAVEAFQARHGLTVTGVVDPRTRAAMNQSLDEAIGELALNLERWRWMPRDLGERYVYVNLPNYRVEVMNGAQRIVDMRVVIGSTEHPTPTFSQDMAYLEFNPTWTVPASIAHSELLPLERRRPGYLKSRNFHYLGWRDGGFVKVPDSRVTREMLSRRPFPYTLRQAGGEGNALGRLKFMFPNPYAIYLHDTPAQKHFVLDDRAYSHGCIRVSDPEHLADVLLRVDGHEAGEVQALLAASGTTRARLTDPVPTHLVYFTAWIDDDGLLQRRTDVYRHDAALRIALEAAGTLLGTLGSDVGT